MCTNKSLFTRFSLDFVGFHSSVLKHLLVENLAFSCPSCVHHGKVFRCRSLCWKSVMSWDYFSQCSLLCFPSLERENFRIPDFFYDHLSYCPLSNRYLLLIHRLKLSWLSFAEPNTQEVLRRCWFFLPPPFTELDYRLLPVNLILVFL